MVAVGMEVREEAAMVVVPMVAAAWVEVVTAEAVGETEEEVEMEEAMAWVAKGSTMGAVGAQGVEKEAATAVESMVEV